MLLIVAADSGVQEQTIEILKNIKKAKKKILVAINKVDRGDANISLVVRGLMEHEIVLGKI